MLHLSPTIKQSNWQGNLDSVIKGAQDAPFVWGTNDCCTFAAKCVDAQYGTDIAAQCMARYSNEQEAQAVIADAGGLVQLISQYMVVADRLTRGCVLVYKGENGLTTGVYFGSKVWAQGQNGVIYNTSNTLNIISIWSEPLCL